MMRLFQRRLKAQESASSQASEDDSSRSPAGLFSRKTLSLRLTTSKKKENGEVPSTPTGASSVVLAEQYARPPSKPNPQRQEQLVEVRGAMRDGPVQVSDTLNLFVATWNMTGVTVLPTRPVLSTWIPLDYDLYAIALQNSRSIKQMQEKILEYLGEEEFHAFKYALMGQTSLLLFARKLFTSSGVLFPTRLNDLVKFEIKTKSLVGGSTGRGCVLMQVVFHNTTMAFVAVNLDDDIDGLERRTADLEFCLQASGIVRSTTNEIGTPVLTSVQHVFLFGNFGVKTLDKCVGASRNTWKGKWSSLLYGKEFDALSKANPSLDDFEELDVNYPPTSRRKAGAGASATLSKDGPGSPRSTLKKDVSVENMTGGSTPERRLSQGFLSMFEKDFMVETLFDAKLVKKEGEPSFQDRVLFRTNDNHKHLMETGCAGSAELVRLGSHVPVFATYRLCGVDASLVQRWQVITGNMPVENATRTDFRMVKGLVDFLVQGINEKAAHEAEEEERERLRQEYLAQMRRCDRCAEPLSLEGGDVDLGDKAAFHRHCFTCEDCGKDLFGEKFMCADDRWLCLASFNRIYQTACPVCQLPIEGPRIRIGKAMVSYHPDCFKCAGPCGQLLVSPQNGSIRDFLDFEGRPYCPADFEPFKDRCCMACKLELAPGDRVRPPVRFHRHCYTCAVCKIDMDKTEQRAVVRDYKVLCEADHLKDVAMQQKKQQFRKEREEQVRRVKEEEELAKKKQEEMMARRISTIPKGFDLSNFDLPEDEDIAEDDEDE